MLVIVKVLPDVADALRKHAGEGDGAASKASSLVNAVRDLGVRLVPMHPKTEDPELKTYFQVDVPDRKTADRIVATLSRAPNVEAAYWKPAEELP